jgi:hypothetical protein
MFALPQRGQIVGLQRPYWHPTFGLGFVTEYPTQEAKSAINLRASREWLTHCQPAHSGKVVTAKAGCCLTGNQAGISPLDEGFFHGLVSQANVHDPSLFFQRYVVLLWVLPHCPCSQIHNTKIYENRSGYPGPRCGTRNLRSKWLIALCLTVHDDVILILRDLESIL